MYAEETLRAHIQAETGYTTELTQDVTLDINNFAGTPKVYVGHLGIKMQYPENFWADGYKEGENPQVLVTAIQFICKRSDLHTVRKKIYDAYSEYSPVQDPNFSRLSFISADVVAKSQNNIWWSEQIGLIFPRIS